MKLTMISSTLLFIDDQGCHDEKVTTTNDPAYNTDPENLIARHTVDVFAYIDKLKSEATHDQ